MKHVIYVVMFFLTGVFSSMTMATTKYQKPGAPIQLATPGIIEMDPFSSKTITVSFSSSSQGELFLSTKPKPGIAVTNNDTPWHFDLSKEKPEITLEIQAEEAGRQYIMFHARIVENGLSSMRVFGMTVNVGKVDVAKKQKSSNNSKFVIMKAEETITQK